MKVLVLSLLLCAQLEPGIRPASDLMMIGSARSSAADFMMAGDMASVAEKRSLHFYGPSWCPACPAALEAVKQELSKEFEIKVHKDYDAYPAWVIAQGQKHGWGYPMVHWTTNSDAGRIMVWSGLEAFRKADGQPKTKVAASVPEGTEAAPTPGQEVERVIGLLPKPEIGFVDYGCGDARWCIAAAERWGCRVTGIEIDPVRAAVARERVRSLGLSHLITIITGDATRIDVEADVGVAYLYADVLQQLRPRLATLRAFASYMHRPPGLPVVQNGNSWLYARSVQLARSAVWQGQHYSAPVCPNPGCAMCNSIRRQLTPM